MKVSMAEGKHVSFREQVSVFGAIKPVHVVSPSAFSHLDSAVDPTARSIGRDEFDSCLSTSPMFLQAHRETNTADRGKSCSEEGLSLMIFSRLYSSRMSTSSSSTLGLLYLTTLSCSGLFCDECQSWYWS